MTNIVIANDNSMIMSLDYNNEGAIGLMFGTMNPNNKNNNIGYFFYLTGNDAVSKEEYYENISVNKAENVFGDRRVSETPVYTSYSLGVNYIPKTRFDKDNRLGTFMFGGIGWTNQKTYYNYKDPIEILGTHGNYTIDGTNDGGGLSILGGLGLINSIPTGYDYYYITYGIVAQSHPSTIGLFIGMGVNM